MPHKKHQRAGTEIQCKFRNVPGKSHAKNSRIEFEVVPLSQKACQLKEKRYSTVDGSEIPNNHLGFS